MVCTMASIKVAALVCCTLRAFFSTAMLTASDVWALAIRVAVLTMVLERAIGQKDGKKWAAAVDLQPTIRKSDRLLVVRFTKPDT